MEDNRKKWIQPQLIVLGRGTPEENVLAGCKTSTLGGAFFAIAGCKRNAAKTKCGTNNKCSVISTTS